MDGLTRCTLFGAGRYLLTPAQAHAQAIAPNCGGGKRVVHSGTRRDPVRCGRKRLRRVRHRRHGPAGARVRPSGVIVFER